MNVRFDLGDNIMRNSLIGPDSTSSRPCWWWRAVTCECSRLGERVSDIMKEGGSFDGWSEPPYVRNC
jgi:hypothetical protein